MWWFAHPLTCRGHSDDYDLVHSTSRLWDMARILGEHLLVTGLHVAGFEVGILHRRDDKDLRQRPCHALAQSAISNAGQMGK